MGVREKRGETLFALFCFMIISEHLPLFLCRRVLSQRRRGSFSTSVTEALQSCTTFGEKNTSLVRTTSRFSSFSLFVFCFFFFLKVSCAVFCQDCLVRNYAF